MMENYVKIVPSDSGFAKCIGFRPDAECPE